MVGESSPVPAEEPPPPPPSVGATIPPRVSVKKPIAVPAYDVSDAGVSGILFTYPRSRKTGKKVTDPITGEEVDEWESYETLHQIQVIPEDVAESVDWVDAEERELKKVKRLIKSEDGRYKVRERAAGNGFSYYVWRGEPPERATTTTVYDEKLHELVYKEVPYTRWIPAKKIVKFVDWDLEYSYYEKLLGEKIIINKPTGSIRWTYQVDGIKYKKIPGSTSAYRLETDEGEDLGVRVVEPTGEDAEGKPIKGLHLVVSATGNLWNLVIPKKNDYSYPVVIS